jgi:5-methylcytosine-specific restriction endonuclease McrA
MSRKFHKLDRERTAAANFLDERSYWTIYGAVFLFGSDKALLRDACFARDRYRCTKCGVPRLEINLDMHHVKPLGKGGDDSLNNVETRCKWESCHRMEHKQVQLHWSKPEAVKVA